MTSKLFIAGIFLAVLLAGCITIDYEQVVSRDGSSLVTEKIDLSALIAMSEQYGEASDLSGICVNLTKGQSGVDCAYQDGIISVNKTLGPGDGQYTFTKSSELPYIVYTLELRKLPSVVSSDELDSSGQTDTAADFKDPKAKSSAATLKAAGAEINYNVSMPGEIFSAEHGQVKDGKAQFDVLELMSDGDYIVVKSRELDLLVVGAGAVIALAALCAAAFFVLKRK